MKKSRLHCLSWLLIHGLFWVASILVFAFIFRLSERVDEPDLINAVFFHLSVIAGVYLNFWAIDKLLNKGRYTLYALAVLVDIVFVVVFNLYTFKVLVDLVLPDYYFVSQFNFIEIGIITFLYFIVTSAIKLFKSWFALQQLNRTIAETEKERIDSELQSLKSQINPHFLFNSLNVIYSLTLTNDKATPEVVLKLSDILRYVIYDSRKEKVLLSAELALLQKYIDLQKYRIEDEASVCLNSEIDYDVNVAPLLFLTLVENSFKHGIKGETGHVFIHALLRSDDRKVFFEIENNKSEPKPDLPKRKGTGLDNLRKRLELEYPDRHVLRIEETDSRFKVYLEIDYEN